MMSAKFRLSNPNEAEAEMTIRMRVREWRELRDQLKSDFPSWTLGDNISKLIALAEEEFKVSDKETP